MLKVEERIAIVNSLVKGDVVELEKTVIHPEDKRVVWFLQRKADYTITAEILSESYGPKKGYHTFKIKVKDIEGPENLKDFLPFREGKIYRRRGCTLYKDVAYRKLWEDEDSRDMIVEEKQRRGAAARGKTFEQEEKERAVRRFIREERHKEWLEKIEYLDEYKYCNY